MQPLNRQQIKEVALKVCDFEIHPDLIAIRGRERGRGPHIYTHLTCFPSVASAAVAVITEPLGYNRVMIYKGIPGSQDDREELKDKLCHQCQEPILPLPDLS